MSKPNVKVGDTVVITATVQSLIRRETKGAYFQAHEADKVEYEATCKLGETDTTVTISTDELKKR